MNQLLAIAFGGAVGALLRFFVSTGMNTWLGRGFPYGTLTVNVLGSLLIGLLTEALILQRIAITMEYRAAILVGLFGSFTTFSTFSLETFYLFEEGAHARAILNVLISVGACLFAVWLGLAAGRILFMPSGGVVRWFGLVLPYGIIVVNAVGACMIGVIVAVLGDKTGLDIEYRAAVMVVVVGAFMTFSSLYLILYIIEHGFTFKMEVLGLLSVFVGNVSVCLVFFWVGSVLARQF
ncbi:MAG: fluoride efflux transporter CrcB [Gammaproteobacteria bacterium]